MAHAICVLECILVEHTLFIVLSPVLHIHWVIANKLELAKTIVAAVGAYSGVDDENLTIRTSKLFWTFVGRKTDIERATIWCLFPWIGGYAYDCRSEKLELTVHGFDTVFKIKEYGKVKITIKTSSWRCRDSLASCHIDDTSNYIHGTV